MKTYLFYVRKSNVFSKGSHLDVYRCETDDPYHVMGEMLYRSGVHIERIDFVECTEHKLEFWKEQGQTIYPWVNKY